ncbi:hypothetical protein DBZ36_00220 [Alginatibacterium sediminis]|uniref:HemY N-terminal domain-containing protein n=1 Tax=Alginatibacterium sediminis TaxID=2164068 RepID=A0A420EN55_9ALTE|nr:heme biosynthesis HemY N-terminal domain-containing protein [Alginatibacterium sediminis]RKF22108.1 hypothetical protein DBZ36_00220 [Alginatibacterium sediminis]
MLKLIVLLIVIGLGMALGPQLAGNKGYVLIAFDQYTVEMSVTSAIFLGFLALCALFLIIWIIRWLWRALVQSSGWWGSRQRKLAHNNTQSGMMAMMRGDYQHAEKLVSKAAVHSERPALNYLAAAEAAQELGNDKKRDAYLDQASKVAKDDKVAVVITRARLALRQGNQEQALKDLETLTDAELKQPQVKQMRAQLYQQLGHWQKLVDLLPEMHKAHLIGETEYLAQLSNAYQQLFSHMATTEGSDAVAASWNRLPRKLKKAPQIVKACCLALIEADDSRAAYQILGDLLSKNQDPELLEACAELKLSDNHHLLLQLQKLAQKHAQNPMLKELQARFLVREERWDEASTLLQSANELEETSQRLSMLALISDKQEQPELALDYYRRALNFSF